jgi:methylated-DNA-[protein]-cysteine S-methyltransferase
MVCSAMKPERQSASVAIGCYPWPVPAIDSVLFLAWSARGLTLAHWMNAADVMRPAEVGPEVPELSPPDLYADLLRRYFAGERVEPVGLPVDLAGTAFQLRVWNALRRIVLGRVRSYAGIAIDIGSPRAMRAVGMANGRNPVAVVVPCHRVIEKNGQLGGYSSGLERKRFLLQLEGVHVSGDDVRPGQLELL